MSQAILPDGRGPRGRRQAAVLAGSVAFHVILLGLIGLQLTEARLPLFATEDAPVIEVEIEPRPLLPGERMRVPNVTSASSVSGRRR